MDLQTQKQPKYEKIESDNEEKIPSKFERLKHKLIKTSKNLVVWLFLRPAVWQWLMVNLPSFVEKAETGLKYVYAYLKDNIF